MSRRDHQERVVFFDLCSGKGLTAVLLALSYPHAEVVALDIISDKCLPHTQDIGACVNNTQQ
jgi:methylase of polypeptide subunit release factors